MKKRIWDLYAPIYKRAMKADQRIYDFMYERIPTKIAGMEVLEIATGPGLLAKHVAPAAKRMVATDYSDGMIAEARNLPYTDFKRTKTLCQGGDCCDFDFVRHDTDAGNGWERSESI